MFKSILVASLLLSSFVCFASDPANEIKEVTVTEIDSDPFDVELPSPIGQVKEVIAVADSIIAIGQKIWKIIDAGRPVINNKLIPSVSVLPKVTGENPVLNDMADWSIPTVKSYRVSAKNYYNSEVIGFTYTIIFQHSGNLNGVGKYINGLRVQASEISVSWGFNFEASSELLSIANVGSKENPVASAIIQVSYSTKAINREDRKAVSFYVDGNGNIKTLN